MTQTTPVRSRDQGWALVSLEMDADDTLGNVVDALRDRYANNLVLAAAWRIKDCRSQTTSGQLGGRTQAIPCGQRRNLSGWGAGSAGLKISRRGWRAGRVNDRATPRAAHDRNQRRLVLFNWVQPDPGNRRTVEAFSIGPTSIGLREARSAAPDRREQEVARRTNSRDCLGSVRTAFTEAARSCDAPPGLSIFTMLMRSRIQARIQLLKQPPGDLASRRGWKASTFLHNPARARSPTHHYDQSD